MNKTSLGLEIAKRTGIDKRTVGIVLNAALGVVRERVAKGDRVTLADFGTFHRQRRAARLGRNPHTGEPVKVPATTKPVFKPGRGFLAQVAPKPRSRPRRRTTTRRSSARR